MPVQDQGETSKAENIAAGEAAKGSYPRAGMRGPVLCNPVTA